MQTENMPSRSDNDFFGVKEKLILPPELRDELKNPLGEKVSEEELESALEGSGKVVCVGDLCSLTLFEGGFVPDIAVVDFATRRGDLGELRAKIRKIGQTVINVNNPPGVITKELWESLYRAYEMAVSVRIEVEGEEDLATLPAVWLAPKGTRVVYGLPHVGLVVVRDLKKAKKMVKNVLVNMK